ncbi:uroporphyrinogen-III C-methyltransferase [Occultella glacieicola]|uniref:uroporphyrinogen-III C-methyltransferase n=1 Tax=Occultella glacieicola TaxID=2518684 RepID=A0ABY2E760_9MICO|nr:uroporphyrinogen-III C-methyltransferase [Occultella glacieicola]TDE97263.1 uroporphyrinogen-III C-methyltransferase [Occultella glacieicola]
MLIETRVDGLTVLVLGAGAQAARLERRYAAAGALVRTASMPDDVTPALLDGVALVVVAFTPAEVSAEWDLTLAGVARTHLLSREPEAPAGQVTLVGGGPGADDLLTLAAVRALATADVILFDRLAPTDHLADLAPGAELIDVGKRPGHHPLGQTEIESLMIERARAGQRVVRLKGGDPFVFGRGAEELGSARAAGVSARVVPGISAAIAVPAAAGIPVTYREVSHHFTVISGHHPLSGDEHAHLTRALTLGGTVVVLMGVGTLPHLLAGLLRAGLARQTPVAAIERGYTPDQASTLSTVGEAVAEATLAGISSPAVIVLGNVVRIGGRADLPGT